MPWPPHELRLYGHRGASARLPENTLAALRQALDDGATALELDLHRTADGHLVVAHDSDGLRMAGVGGWIRDLPLREVKRWNVAAGFRDGAGSSHAVPTLDEVLESFPGVPLAVDLKPDDPRAVPELLTLIARHAAAPLVTVGSFHGRLVKLARRLSYPGPTALTRWEVAALRLLPEVLARGLVAGRARISHQLSTAASDVPHSAVLSRLGVLEVLSSTPPRPSGRNPHCARHLAALATKPGEISGLAAIIPRHGMGIDLDGRGFIGRCRALGLRVDYWVVNDPDDARELLDRGATGIISDDPAQLAPVFRGR